MMTRSARWIGVCGLLLILSGCGWIGSDSANTNSNENIPELGDSEKTTKVREAAKTKISTENPQLQLKIGDRFPLIKTVEQRLRQLSPIDGQPIDSSSKLSMTLAVTVENIDQGVKTLGVRYQRVLYDHDIAGETVSYDSALLPKTVPVAAQVYHGLLDNTFSFDLGADNCIVKVHEFDEFLKRCVRHAPASQQQEMLTCLMLNQEDEGIANFVDDSVGILPYNIDDLTAGGDVKVGSSWRKSREITRPFPMTIDTAYRLAEINERYATLELSGQIVPARIQRVSNTSQHQGATEKMTLRSGHSFGTCTIDRESGLPIQSHVTRTMKLTLELPTGVKFDQTKDIVTTIRTFTEQGAPATAAKRTTPQLAPTSSESSPSGIVGSGTGRHAE
ncbi:MAG: hypothetical protein FJ302_08540 [Planctomycetes bacterium]|nr:hypothetical protein [Planctomycetota bacterium]